MTKIKNELENIIKKVKNKSNNKIYIGFNARLVLNIILFLICFILVFVFILKSFSIVPEERINYTDKSNLDYKVYLKENSFYEDEYLNKDMIYVASLIDRVNVAFDYDFNTDINLDLDFKYSIFAKLTIQDTSGKSNYFEKNYTLLDEKTLNLIDDNKLNINEIVDIDYSYYNSIANTFKTNYGVDSISNLTIYLKIDKESPNEEILLTDSDIMSLEIPLSEKSLSIKMDYKEINNTSNLISKSNLLVDNRIYMVLTAIFLVLLLILTVRIVRLLGLLRNKKNKYDKYVKKLLTEYDRLISETSTLPNTTSIEIIAIKKFQELVDIRDNLKLPIMYYSITKHHKCWFYITHSNKMYLHVVKAVDLE